MAGRRSPLGSPTAASSSPSPTFSLDALGRAIQAEYPNDFKDADVFQLGQAALDEYPELHGLIDPVKTAAAMGVDVAPRVGMQPASAAAGGVTSMVPPTVGVTLLIVMVPPLGM